MSYRGGYARKNSEDEIKLGESSDDEFYDEPRGRTTPTSTARGRTTPTSTTRGGLSRGGSTGGGGGGGGGTIRDERYAPTNGVLILMCILILLLAAGIGIGTYFAYDEGLFKGEDDPTPQPTPKPSSPPTPPPTPSPTTSPTTSPQPTISQSPTSSIAPTIAQNTSAPVMTPAPTSAPVTLAPVELPECSICGDGLFVTNYDGIYSVDGQPDRTCSDLESESLNGNINSIECAMIQTNVQEICGCSTERTDDSVLELLAVVVGPGVNETGNILNDAANWLLLEDPRFVPLPSRRRKTRRRLQDICNICGEGNEITIPDGEVEVSGVSLTCTALQQLGITDDDQCNVLQNITQMACGCTMMMEMNNNTNTSSPVQTPAPTPEISPPTNETATPAPTVPPPPDGDITLSDISNDELIQRYLVILFYFQTTNNLQDPWNSDCRAADTTTSTGGDGDNTTTTITNETSSCEYVTPNQMRNGQLDDGVEVEQASKWLSSDLECDWAGISCTSDGYVESIILVQFDLRGTLPTELLELPELQLLNFAHNNITGTLPAGYLSKLQGLELNHNQIEGNEFGSAGLWEQSTIQYLNVAANKLSGLLPTNTNANLQLLFAYQNNLLGTVPAYYLAGGIGLMELDISDNSFVGIIPNITQEDPTKGIVSLNLSGNNIEGDIVVESTILESLILSDNRFQGVLPSSYLEGVASLTSLNISGNLFTGSLPPSLGNLTLLESLDVSNQLSIGFDGTIPTEYGQLTNLKGLQMHQNSLNMNIPTELLQLTDLSVFTIDRNDVTGVVPFCNDTMPVYDFDLLRADCFEILCLCCTVCCSRSACFDTELII